MPLPKAITDNSNYRDVTDFDRSSYVYIYIYGQKIIYSWTDWWGPPENSWACNCMTNGTYEGVDDDVVKEAKLNHSTLIQVSMKLCNPMIIDKTSTLQHLENPKLIRLCPSFTRVRTCSDHLSLSVNVGCLKFRNVHAENEVTQCFKMKLYHHLFFREFSATHKIMSCEVPRWSTPRVIWRWAPSGCLKVPWTYMVTTL